MIITYRERYFIDRFRCIDRTIKISVLSYFTQGSLIYAKVDAFNIKVISKEDIISIGE